MKMRMICVLSCMAFVLTACKSTNDMKGQTDMPDVFVGEMITFEETFTPTSVMVFEDPYLYVLGPYTVVATGGESVHPAIAVLDTKTMDISYDILPDGSYDAFAVGKNGYLLSSCLVDENSGMDVFQLTAVDAADGCILWKQSLYDMRIVPMDFLGQVTLQSLDDGWVIGAGSTLAMISIQGNVTAKKTLSGDILTLKKNNTGELCILGEQYYIVSDATGELQPMDYPISGKNLLYGADCEYYYTNENGLYGHKDDGDDEIMNWVSSGLVYAGNVKTLIVQSPETVYIYGNDGIGGKTGLWKYTKADDVVLTDVEIIRVTYNEDGRNKIPLAAVKFNAAQSQYRIVCEEFSSAYTGSDLMDSFDKAILAGNIGDIVVTQDFDTYRKYGEKGVYADLYTLMNNELSEGDIFGCVRRACEIDGKLYGLPQEFSLDTYAIKQGCIDLETWNLEAFITLSDSLTTGKSILLSMTQEDVYNALRDSIIAECIDFENHTCSFDSDIFLHFLEYIDSLPQENTEEMDWNENNYINGKAALFNSNINSYASYYQMKSVFGEEADADIVGYPSSEGGASKLSANAFYSITEESKVKEGAMAFLRYLLSADCVIDEMRGMRSIPSLKTTAKAWDDSESKIYYYFYYDNIGRWSADSKPITEEDEGVPGICIQLTQEKIDAVYDFLDHVNVYPYIPSDIAAILDEEMYVFLDTTKTADEIAKIIQSRVSTYLSERG